MATSKAAPVEINMTFDYNRDTTNFAVYNQKGGINKLYLPLPTNGSKPAKTATVVIKLG